MYRLPHVTRQVLQVPDLLRCMMQFRQGLHIDMFPLRYLTMPLTTNSSDLFPSEFANIDLALSPWYFQHGFGRVLRLVECIPRLLPLVLYHAVYHGITPVVQLLASAYDLRLASDHHHLLDIAAFTGSVDMFTYLLGVVGPAGMSSYASEWEVENGHLVMVQYLNEHRLASFDVQSVLLAAQWDHVELLRYLLDLVKPASVEEAIAIAASQGRKRAVQFLMSRRSSACTPSDVEMT